MLKLLLLRLTRRLGSIVLGSLRRFSGRFFVFASSCNLLQFIALFFSCCCGLLTLLGGLLLICRICTTDLSLANHLGFLVFVCNCLLLGVVSWHVARGLISRRRFYDDDFLWTLWRIIFFWTLGGIIFLISFNQLIYCSFAHLEDWKPSVSSLSVFFINW